MRRLCSAIILLAALPATAAEVYRSVDENGTVVYSDRPDHEGNERVYVATTRPGTPRTAVTSRTAAQEAQPAPGEGETLGIEQRREPSTAELADQREKNCSIARDRVEQYGVAHRLYRTLPDGEREYLTDSELGQARAKAEADVANWCS
jgi:Domain of unknown function (DUF4124)